MFMPPVFRMWNASAPRRAASLHFSSDAALSGSVPLLAAGATIRQCSAKTAAGGYRDDEEFCVSAAPICAETLAAS